MALRKTLNELVESLRKECRLSSNTSRGIDDRDFLEELLRRHYYQLAEEHDWEHLQIKRDASISRKSVAAGQRHYDFPTALNVQKIEKAWVLFSGTWRELEYGINFPEYTAQDPEEDQRADPVLAWDFYGGTQFEVWPLPASNHSADAPYQVAFQGQKTVEQLTQTTSRADLDDMLIVLAAAAEVLAGNDNEKVAALKREAFARRLDTVRGGLSSKTRIRVGMGRVGGERRGPRTIDYVRSR
jgi:hypothetical protein